MPLFRKTRGMLQPVLFLLAMSISMTATASSYLQELEAEAASTNDSSNQKEGANNNAGWSSTQQSTENHETVEKGLTKDKFEEALKTRFYGSYLFYSTLNDHKQELVYEEYLKNNDIEYLREVIKAQISN